MKSDRNRALEVLQQAREILAQRLTERVLDSAEEILNDARGDSYMNDIDQLYDQVGTRLAHINQMISALPAAAEANTASHTTTAHTPPYDDATFAIPADVEPSHEHFAHDPTPALVGPLYVAAPALPAPRIEEPAEVNPVSFVTFVSQIRANDLPNAGQTLAQLFQISSSRGLQCAELFAERMERDANFLSRAMQLRVELQGEGFNGALVLLYECFGLTGIESIAVLQTLRSRMSAE